VPGPNSAQFTVPLWPGSLYRIFPVSFDQTTTVPSPAPVAILLPSRSQLARMRFFSIPMGAPSNVRICLSVGAKCWISHVLAVESMAYERSDRESGDTRSDVMVSWWPSNEYQIPFFVKLHTLISLSIPPKYISSPAGDRATDVTGNSVWM